MSVFRRTSELDNHCYKSLGNSEVFLKNTACLRVRVHTNSIAALSRRVWISDSIATRLRRLVAAIDAGVDDACK